LQWHQQEIFLSLLETILYNRIFFILNLSQLFVQIGHYLCQMRIEISSQLLIFSLSNFRRDFILIFCALEILNWRLDHELLVDLPDLVIDDGDRLQVWRAQIALFDIDRLQNVQRLHIIYKHLLLLLGWLLLCLIWLIWLILTLLIGQIDFDAGRNVFVLILRSRQVLHDAGHLRLTTLHLFVNDLILVSLDIDLWAPVEVGCLRYLLVAWIWFQRLLWSVLLDAAVDVSVATHTRAAALAWLFWFRSLLWHRPILLTGFLA